MSSPSRLAMDEDWATPESDKDFVKGLFHLEKLAAIAHAHKGCDCSRCRTRREARAYLGLDPNG